MTDSKHRGVSDLSSPIQDTPDSPTIGTAVNVGTGRAFNDGAATVPFTTVVTGGRPATYVATSSPDGITATSATSPVTVSGLSSATAYTFTVAGRTAGSVTGPQSTASNSITATTVPQAPTIGTVTVTNSTTVTIPFTAGATGGSTITSYTATSSPSIALSVSGTSSPLAVTGTFAFGQEYTFTIAAVNANGTSSASSASNSVTPFSVIPSVEYLVVAGGAAGSNNGPGGGAGGYRTGVDYSVSSGTTYTVTIGAGGVYASNTQRPGSNSVFDTVTSAGGGGAGVDSPLDGQAGGTGGGGRGVTNGSTRGLGGTGNTPSTSPVQGYKGGNGAVATAIGGFIGGHGGGGGAGGAGVNGTSGTTGHGTSGAGGAGVANSISGSSVTYGVGAAGSPPGVTTPGVAGTVNRGNGGKSEGSGGSGIVVIRYPDTYPAATSTTGSPTITTTGGNRIYRFTGSGSITF
jgi:hypothetical protein